ncbi:hypothetical protein [Mesorhizobium sp. DCY119]|uniref:hypothetical protein n=1 Tax=Mesorhizobium sp. DCY119 TaxID=2108445 RepID=UPI0013C47E8F|nr:hypothetical protein [Mesorhizobium sp. DCY119]
MARRRFKFKPGVLANMQTTDARASARRMVAAGLSRYLSAAERQLIGDTDPDEDE